MTKPRLFAPALVLAAMVASPAAAQIYWRAPDLSGLPLTSYEPGMGVALPGATPAEQRAAISWNVRSGLNLAALQCAFEPTLRTEANYNAIISDHSAELAAAFNTLSGYFKRTSKTPKAGQSALDTFGTRTYSGFSAVRAQLTFCNMAGKIGRHALFTPKGQFSAFAMEHLREFRNSLVPAGDQQFRFPRPWFRVPLPNFDERCWRGNRYNRACGGVIIG